MSHPNICVRCGAQTHPSVEHVCKDVAARYQRRKRQADAVEEIISPAYADAIQRRAVAEAIVTTLARMGVTED